MRRSMTEAGESATHAEERDRRPELCQEIKTVCPEFWTDGRTIRPKLSIIGLFGGALNGCLDAMCNAAMAARSRPQNFGSDEADSEAF